MTYRFYDKPLIPFGYGRCGQKSPTCLSSLWFMWNLTDTQLNLPNQVVHELAV